MSSAGSYSCRQPDDQTFDCIWSISVIEHIPIPEDIEVLTEMERVLKPGGYLLLTLPGSKESSDEYCEENVYGLPSAAISCSSGRCFFQRWYDDRLIKERIENRISSMKLVKSEVVGEVTEGWFDHYMNCWRSYGDRVTCLDPFLFFRHFGQFGGLSEAPGKAIICLLFRKG